MLSDKPETREVISHELVWRGKVFDMARDEVRVNPGEAAVPRDYVVHPGAVAILALRGESGAEEILLLRQYRHPVGALLWEIPAGLRDVSQEEWPAAAARELWEEADLTAARWDILGDFFTTPGGSTESLRVYLARDLTEVPPSERFDRTDEEKNMLRQWISLDDAVIAVQQGRIHNPSAVFAILAASVARSNQWTGLRTVDSPWWN